MRVATAERACTSGVEAAVGEVLDRRLLAMHERPVAVALSGGGDSLALTLAVAAWAERAGRKLLVLTVDHRLQPESAGWTAACAVTAARLDLAFRPLAWSGEKPAASLPAAARRARHALLADAARAAGARVILMGHTADDVLEAQAMRAAGSTTPSPREWSPSPAWPQGRGLFLARPLLGVRRAEIRDWLGARGEAWIEDPANADLTYARPRARRALASVRPVAAAPTETQDISSLALACTELAGALRLRRAILRDAVPSAARRFVGAACLCAAGTDRPPAGARVLTLAERLIGAGDVTATLAGARIEADALEVRFLREAGEAARGGLAPLQLAAGETGVWDGRFEIAAHRPMEVRRLAGLGKRLSRQAETALRGLPPSLRPTLPAAVDEAGNVSLPAASSLVRDRLLAACGAIDREPA